MVAEGDFLLTAEETQVGAQCPSPEDWAIKVCCHSSQKGWTDPRGKEDPSFPLYGWKTEGRDCPLGS